MARFEREWAERRGGNHIGEGGRLDDPLDAVPLPPFGDHPDQAVSLEVADVVVDDL